MPRLTIFSLSLLACASIAHAQYKFDSKKAEKLYHKLEEYYAEADYESILENEPLMDQYFLTKKDTLGALMYSFLGEAYLYGRNDLNQSLTFFQKEYDLREALHTKKEDMKILIFNLGYLQDELGFYTKTESLYLELLELEEQTSGVRSEDYFRVGSSLLDHYVFTEEYQKGQILAQKLGKTVEKDSFEEAMILRFTGDYYEMAGAYRKSEKALLHSLEILKATGYYPSIEYVAVMNSLATTYISMANIPVAEELYQDAISIIDRLTGDFSDYRMAVNGNLALMLRMLGNYDQAEAMYLNNLKADEEFYGTESFVYGMDAYNLADNYKYAENYPEAELWYLKAANVFQNDMGEENLYYARVIQSLTQVYTKTGQLDKAKEYGLRAIRLVEATAGENLYQISFAYYNLGDAYFTAGELSEAEKYHTKALDLRKKGVGQSHADYARSTNKLAILYWKKAAKEDAIDFYRQTFKNYFDQIRLIFPILSEDEKTKFYYNNLRPVFEQYNSFIVKMSSDRKELLGEMYDNQLATKGLILYATNKIREAIQDSGDSILIRTYNQWIEQKEQLARLFSSNELSVETRNRKIDSLTTLSNTLEKQLSKASSEFARNQSNLKVTWKDVQARLKPGEAAVEIIRFRDFTPDSAGMFTDQVYYAALIVTASTKEHPELVIMDNGQQMETKYLSNYRNAIKYQIEENFSYKLFWEPIAQKLKGIKKVYFSPDGVYNQISIYTLRNPATGKYTLDELQIQQVTNTKDLVAFNDAGPAPGGKSYLFGFPNYNMGAIDQKAGNTGTSAEKIVMAASENRGVRGIRSDDEDLSALSTGTIPRGLRGNMLRYMRSTRTLALLPGTKKEVTLIDSLYLKKQQPAVMHVSNEALEDSVKTVMSPKTLHIATHGFFLENDLNEKNDPSDNYVQNPLLRSGLILAGANSFIVEGEISENVPYQEDGILTAYEAMNLHLEHTELVVLSACETGLGEIRNGEGVYGLQRAFQVAGADAVIMSMWTVDDAATQELMTHFYAEWLTGADKHTAFSNAQKQLKAKWKHPYFWGAFVMIGQ